MMVFSVELHQEGLLVRLEENDQNMNAEIRTFISALKSCARVKDLDLGSQIHAEICSHGLANISIRLCNMLLNMYVKCGVLVKAQQVLYGLSPYDAVSWNIVISGYVKNGQVLQAVSCFQRMQSEGIFPDAFTFSCIFKACSISGDAETGKKLHETANILGMIKNDVVLANAIIDMYVKCDLLTRAHEVLDALLVRNVVSWTALITGYVQHEKGVEALACYDQMQREGISPNAVTYACILKACGITQDPERGKQIHNKLVSEGMLKNDVILGNSLIDMYVKCSLLALAQEVLDKLPARDVISWSTLISGYTENGQGQEALQCFWNMQREGFIPNAVTYTSILKACGITLEVDIGRQIHEEILRQGLLDDNVMLGTSLVGMYVKCGAIGRAQKAFDELSRQDVMTWNALIKGYAQYGQRDQVLKCLKQMRSQGLSPNVVCWNTLTGGYAQQGLAEEVLDCFYCMEMEGISPDAITFLNMLYACSHAGLVDEGLIYFASMVENYVITPEKEHHVCMVDLFARARSFEMAMRIAEKMPFPDYLPAWSALLGACQNWGNVKLGRLAFEHAAQLNGCTSGPYVLMANTCATLNMEENLQIVDCLSVSIGVFEEISNTRFM